jgi:3-carboxy-cis,cis-muconate cycloisomerase
MVQINESDASGSNIIQITLPEICVMTVSIVETLSDIISGLQVDSAAMRRNLEISDGLIMSEAVMMALANRIGRHAAHHVLYEVAMGVADGGVGFENALRERLDMLGLADAGGRR